MLGKVFGHLGFLFTAIHVSLDAFLSRIDRDILGERKLRHVLQDLPCRETRVETLALTDGTLSVYIYERGRQGDTIRGVQRFRMR